jgi:hypothetical protein
MHQIILIRNGYRQLIGYLSIAGNSTLRRVV